MRLHFGVAGIRQDGAIAERARAIFHRSLKQTHDAPSGKEGGYFFGPRLTFERLVGVTIGGEEFLHVLVAETRSQV